MFNSESYRRGVVVSTFFNFFAKSLGFFQSVAIAYYFGSQIVTDIYLYFYGLALLFASFLNGMDQTVIIPEAIRIKTQLSKNEAIRFINSFLYIYLLIIIIALAVFFSSPLFWASHISKYGVEILAQNFYLVAGAISLVMLIVLTTYLSNVLLAFRFFSIPVLVAVINSLISLTLLLILKNTLGFFSIILGLIIGYSLSIVLVLFLMFKKLDWRFEKNIYPLKKLSLKNLFYAQLGNFSTLLSSYIPLYILTGYAAGLVTSITYAIRTADIPNQIIVMQITSILGIKFNEQIAEQNYTAFARSFVNYSKLALSFLIPLSIFLCINSQPFIEILYGRGKFDSNSVSATAFAFSILILNVPLYAINSFVARVFIANQRLDISFLYQLIMNICYILLIYILMRIFGSIGYPMATVSIYLLSFLLVFYLLKKINPILEYKLVIWHMLKVVTITAIIGGISFLVVGQLNFSGFSGFILSAICFLIFFLPIAKKFDFFPSIEIKFPFRRSKIEM